MSAAETESPRGIDVDNVTRWYVEHVPGAAPPLAFELIAGGHSNLTFKVTDGRGTSTVVRRPPLHHVLPTAHDMSREHRIIAALGKTQVPVPPAIGLCADAAVNGAPFYVMGFVDGVVLHDIAAVERGLAETRRHACGESFADVLADLHAVDPDAVGLGDLGRKEGYIERQLKRWYGQFQQSKTRELPAVDKAHDLLRAHIPEQGRASVVHGDYRLGNCITEPSSGRIAAVLDWEICTLGDPLADVGYVLATWPQPGDPDPSSPDAPTLAAGFPLRSEFLDRYARRSSRDLARIDFYVAFSMWKSACIIEGVYARYVGGALGETKVDLETFRRRIDRFADEAWETASRVR